MHPILAAVVLTFAAWQGTHAYLADEPDFTYPGLHTGTTPDQLAARYQHADHSTTQWVSFVDCRNAARYRQSFDGLMFDDYPIYADDGRTPTQQLAEWERTVRRCVTAARRLHKAGPVAIVQAFGGVQDGFTPVSWRCPTPREFVWMVQDAYGWGVSNVIAYTDRSHPCPRLQSYIKEASIKEVTAGAAVPASFAARDPESRRRHGSGKERPRDTSRRHARSHLRT